MHKIDLSKYEVRTDMIVDLLDEETSKLSNETLEDGVKISWMKLDEDNPFNKKPGNYLTILFDDVTDNDARNLVSNIFKREFKKMLKKIGYNKDYKTLVIGLGNEKSTPDALGSLVVCKLIVTNHFFDMNINVDDKLSKMAAIAPGVTGQTGIETSDYVKGVVGVLKPDLVILVDALCSSSIENVNKSIQVTDNGISPGSGIGNKRKEISKETLNTKVISVGIPTVIDASTIVSDTINYMVKNYAYNKKHINDKSNKFIKGSVNYLNKETKITPADRKNFLGLVGALSDNEIKNLLYEVLTPIGYNLMVTPKEVDFILSKLSDVISYGINHSIHNI